MRASAPRVVLYPPNGAPVSFYAGRLTPREVPSAARAAQRVGIFVADILLHGHTVDFPIFHPFFCWCCLGCCQFRGIMNTSAEPS